MKTREEIEKEYEEFIISEDYLENMQELQTYLDVRQDDLDEGLKTLKKEKRTNKKYRSLGELISFLTVSIIPSNPEFFDEDNKIIDFGMETVLTFKDYYSEMSKIMTEENFRELARLAVFSISYYNGHVEYVEYLRDVLERNFNGVNYYNPNYEDNTQSFDLFMREHLKKNANKKGKTMEKIK